MNSLSGIFIGLLIVFVGTLSSDASGELPVVLILFGSTVTVISYLYHNGDRKTKNHNTNGDDQKIIEFPKILDIKEKDD
jgi:hypothetical protein